MRADPDLPPQSLRIVETSQPAQTETLGAELASELKPGDVVLLYGQLGAGKTTLVRGAARALGVEDPITSPTFSIGHRYQGSSVTVSHIDLYRVTELANEDPALLEDYLSGHEIAFVEWPAAIGQPQARLQITLSHAGGDRRHIEVLALG
jgi:tRNA threonylcarbamoyladenosine biosynthesis protein TsaE